MTDDCALARFLVVAGGFKTPTPLQGTLQMDTQCYTARFVQPFAQLLGEYERYPRKSLEALNAIDFDSRIPMQTAHSLAVEQVQQTGDPDIGLKAARLMPFGRLGAVTYAAHSAATLREAIEVTARYAPLFCDGAIIDLRVQDKLAVLRLGSTVPRPRAITDFTIAHWYFNRGYPAAGREVGYECCFSFPRPQNTAEYDRTFTQAGLRFGAPFDGFVFAREVLDFTLPSADSTVHLVLRQHLDLSVSHLSGRRTIASVVRDIIMRDLMHTTPTARMVARQLGMSARTLNRRLCGEGMTFGTILDQLRHELALRYITAHDVSLSEVSSRLRFSHLESFHRAFKRWTGQTPSAYKRGRRL